MVHYNGSPPSTPQESNPRDYGTESFTDQVKMLKSHGLLSQYNAHSAKQGQRDAGG